NSAGVPVRGSGEGPGLQLSDPDGTPRVQLLVADDGAVSFHVLNAENSSSLRFFNADGSQLLSLDSIGGAGLTLNAEDGTRIRIGAGHGLLGDQPFQEVVDVGGPNAGSRILLRVSEDGPTMQMWGTDGNLIWNAP